MSDLPVSDSSITNDPITCLPTEQLANFSTEQPRFPLSTTSDIPGTTSGDEAAVHKIKEYLLNDHEQQKKPDSNTNQEIQSMQAQDKNPAQYGFLTQGYKKEGDRKNEMRQQVYEDLGSSSSAVRFEQYIPINKRIVKTTRTKR